MINTTQFTIDIKNEFKKELAKKPTFDEMYEEMTQNLSPVQKELDELYDNYGISTSSKKSIEEQLIQRKEDLLKGTIFSKAEERRINLLPTMDINNDIEIAEKVFNKNRYFLEVLIPLGARMESEKFLTADNPKANILNEYAELLDVNRIALDPLLGGLPIQILEQLVSEAKT